MARKLRMEVKGGYYHVINRGNDRHQIFEENGVKEVFEKTLLEGCERAEWILHAFCIMGNQYHAAIETPRGNLSEGMRWVQSTFANRVNRERKAGNFFRGRFKSLLVEDTQWLAWLSHYIHLCPVRTGICSVAKLKKYRWSSLWYLSGERKRSKAFQPKVWLTGASAEGATGGIVVLHDTPRGWARYGDYLEQLAKNQSAQKEMNFERMTRGWAIGTKTFRKAFAEDEERRRSGIKVTRVEAKDARVLAWGKQLRKYLRVLEKTSKDIQADRKSAPWKVAVAGLLKGRLMCTNGWLGEQLKMGTPFGVSRYVTEMHAGARLPALKVYRDLSAKVK